MPKPNPNPASPDCPLCHSESRDVPCSCTLDAIERDLQDPFRNKRTIKARVRNVGRMKPPSWEGEEE